MTRGLRTFRVSIDVSVEDDDVGNPDNEGNVIEDAIQTAYRIFTEQEPFVEELHEFYEELD